MTWTYPEEPPEGVIAGEFWLAVCPKEDLQVLCTTAEGAQQRVQRHTTETGHTRATVERVAWYQRRLQYYLQRPPELLKTLIISNPLYILFCAGLVLGGLPLWVAIVMLGVTNLLLALPILVLEVGEPQRISTLRP